MGLFGRIAYFCDLIMGLRIGLALLLLWQSIHLKAQVHLGVFAGPQLTSARYLISSIKQPVQDKFGFMAGVAAKVDFESNFYFFPAIYYSLRGYKVTLNMPSYPPSESAKNNNTTLHTIQIAPLFNVDLSKKPSSFFVRFGPSINVTIAGKERFDTAVSGGFVERGLKFAVTDYGRITASANVQLGYQTKEGLMIFLHYEYGLGSMSNADGGPIILHRVFGIAAGWFLKHNPRILRSHPHRYR